MYANLWLIRASVVLIVIYLCEVLVIVYNVSIYIYIYIYIYILLYRYSLNTPYCVQCTLYTHIKITKITKLI